MATKYEKGHTFQGPDGQGYRTTRDIQYGEHIAPSQFEAFGGAPEPKAEDVLPHWFARLLAGDNP